MLSWSLDKDVFISLKNILHLFPQSISGGPFDCSAFESVSHGVSQFAAASFFPSSSQMGIPVHLSKAHIAELLNCTLLVA